MILIDRIFVLLAIVFAILGVINGARHQILALISIVVCSFLTLYLQSDLIDLITKHISQEPVINFLVLCAFFFLLYFLLKHLILTITYSNKGNNKSSFVGHIVGAVVGIANCWMLVYSLLAIASNHSQTRSTADDLCGHSTFIAAPFAFSNMITSWRPSRDFSRKLTKAEPKPKSDSETDS
ncbi:MAG: CvpA family protein [Alphaproteobacteria bacterium]|nr:CvpA family protein [Alphaproteobacteria bacterium]